MNYCLLRFSSCNTGLGHRIMPNTGQPSFGCYNCRQRRIRCDLERPQCRRCLINGQTCRGYRDELAMRFRVDTVSSFHHKIGHDRRKRATKAGGQAVQNTEDSELQQETHKVHTIEHDTRKIHSNKTLSHRISFGRKVQQRKCFLDQHDAGSQSFSRQRYCLSQNLLQESWKDQAMPMAIHLFSSDMVNGDNASSFNFIPRLLSGVNEGSSIYYVGKTIGCSYLFHLARSSSTVTQILEYGNALSAINSALRDEEKSKRDDTLLSVWLLSVYEISWGTRHELLRIRDLAQFSTTQGEKLFFMVFNTIQCQAIMTGQDFPEERFTWIEEAYRRCEFSSYRHATTTVQNTIFATHCARICSLIRQLISTKDPNILLRNLSFILQNVDEVEKLANAFFSSDETYTEDLMEPSLAPCNLSDHIDFDYISHYLFRSIFRMYLSYYTLEFLNNALEAPACTSDQLTFMEQCRSRYIEEFQMTTSKALYIVVTTSGIGSVPSLNPFKGNAEEDDQRRPSHIVGLTDVIRVMGILVVIVRSSISLDWQRETAQRALISLNNMI
ncbi:hypothetical protein BGW36DRAFT_83850 [Talaromyces proteolyticus]|uniref:Zn(2)-C6 fungal-type domain-containing protein n=1 Tax=Talaromyces proteolyticus TaxID=1131652 RepID=A0AAD4KX73_9EURO|nr:uncharacterized protein BGW36DRAFT_83850 [Talaromyces proteolyticus]KAH8703195.1 hypothetical protein BGW36DRAFT_83850 [Talaromyces proteolyticus]